MRQRQCSQSFAFKAFKARQLSSNQGRTFSVTANVAFGLRPVRRLLLRRRRRRLRGIVHPLQHAHDGVEPRLRVLALLARPPASNPRGELRRGSSMQDGQQAKAHLALRWQRHSRKERGRGWWVSRETGRGNGSVCASAPLAGGGGFARCSRPVILCTPCLR